jgi:hypothetical protein
MSKRRRSDHVLVEGGDYVIDKNIPEGDDYFENLDKVCDQYFAQLFPVECWMFENQLFIRDIWREMNITGPSDN